MSAIPSLSASRSWKSGRPSRSLSYLSLMPSLFTSVKAGNPRVTSLLSLKLGTPSSSASPEGSYWYDRLQQHLKCRRCQNQGRLHPTRHHCRSRHGRDNREVSTTEPPWSKSLAELSSRSKSSSSGSRSSSSSLNHASRVGGTIRILDNGIATCGI